MHYQATIRTTSSVHSRWRRMGKLVGALEGTRFVWRGAHFVSVGEIADLPALLNHPDVLVEAMGRRPVAPPPAPVVEAPVVKKASDPAAAKVAPTPVDDMPQFGKSRPNKPNKGR